MEVVTHEAHDIRLVLFRMDSDPQPDIADNGFKLDYAMLNMRHWKRLVRVFRCEIQRQMEVSNCSIVSVLY